MPMFKVSFHSTVSFWLICVLLISSTGDLNASDWRLITSVKGDRIKLDVNNKSRIYWELKQKESTKIQVDGPTTLRVYTRAALEKNRTDVLYGFIAIVDEKERYFIGRGSSYIKTVSNPKRSKEHIAEARSIEFDVPPGTHEYAFTLPGEVKNPVYVRFLVEEESKEGISYIPFLPRKFSKEVRIAIKEREYIYYRSTKDLPVELEVIGPTRVRGLARLEFDHTIRGEKRYRVQVSEYGKVILTKPVTAQVSGTATYMEPTDKVPAKGENFYIDVPEGKHRLKVFTPDTGISVLFRFYLPQKDLGNVLPDNDSAHVRFLKFNKSDHSG